MKVLILSTYEKTGGAAIAANRLLHALRKSGVEAVMLSRKNITWWPKQLKPQSYTSLWERFVIFLRLLVKTRASFVRVNSVNTPMLGRMKKLWAIDLANCGQDITKTKEYEKADVIHLHWINQGFISLDTIGKILRSGKRVVWTMHDEWPLEGIEHYTGDDVSEPSADKLRAAVIKKKKHIYDSGRITFVTCSEWLGNIARKKELGQGRDIVSIPNPIDTGMFKPMDKETLRKELGLPTDKKLLLFGCQKVTDERKGLRYLMEAAEKLKNDGRLTVVLVGQNTESTAEQLPLQCIPMGTIRNVERMAQLYAACDCFVTPSLQDNLPNTIMEAMACGTPCVGFNVGGIPEMIDHRKNGYVAEYRNAGDLAEGICYVLSEEEYQRLSVSAREKVEECYSEKSVASRYIQIYNEV